MSEILKDVLFLGDEEDSTCLDFLKKKGIKSLLNCAFGIDHLKKNKVYLEYGSSKNDKTYKKLNLHDVEDEDISKYFKESYDYIRSSVEKSIPILVFCQAGVSRSATILTHYLMKSKFVECQKKKEKPKEILKLTFEMVCKLRTCVSPNLGFMMALCQKEEEYQKTYFKMENPCSSFDFNVYGAEHYQENFFPDLKLELIIDIFKNMKKSDDLSDVFNSISKAAKIQKFRDHKAFQKGKI